MVEFNPIYVAPVTKAIKVPRAGCFIYLDLIFACNKCDRARVFSSSSQIIPVAFIRVHLTNSLCVKCFFAMNVFAQTILCFIT